MITGAYGKTFQVIKIETRQLEIFAAVYRCGSFTKAAEHFSTSQPTISEQIKALEERLGCRLFDRLGRTIKATGKAETLYPKALAIIDEIAMLEAEMAAEERNISGELIIGASSIPGNYILPQVVKKFKRDNSGVFFEVRIADSAAITGAVLSHDLLVGVVGAKNSTKKLKFTPLLKDEMVVAASPNRQLDREIEVSNLLKLPFILREKGSGTRKSILEFLGKNSLGEEQLNTVAVLGSNAAIKEALKADLGVSILSRLSISEELASGKLKEVQIKGHAIARTFYLVTLKNLTLPARYKVFVNTLLKKQAADLNEAKQP